jgi:inhibitor of KinA
MRLVPLGDQAILAYLDDEAAALGFAARVRDAAPPWLVDVVPAYASVGVFFDPLRVGSLPVTEELRHFAAASAPDATKTPVRQHRIPCCYELGQDLERVAGHAGLGTEEVIRLHTSAEYTVYAIGFCPGFPYLGYLPAELSGVPRLPAPRLRVEAGSVGLTGRQTGIYPEVRPGGWNLVGRTPLQLVDVADGYFPLRTGDRVRFECIDRAEFERLRGQRL